MKEVDDGFRGMREFLRDNPDFESWLDSTPEFLGDIPVEIIGFFVGMGFLGLLFLGIIASFLFVFYLVISAKIGQEIGAQRGFTVGWLWGLIMGPVGIALLLVRPKKELPSPKPKLTENSTKDINTGGSE